MRSSAAAISDVSPVPARALAHAPTPRLTGAVARMFEPRSFGHVRMALDLALAGAGALAAVLASPVALGRADHILAVAFPAIALGMLHLRPAPDERLDGSALDTAAHVLGVISLAVMVTTALGVMLGSVRPVSVALRLWLFGFGYVVSGRMMLIWVRRHAVRNQALATPTLILGAGRVGEWLCRRLSTQPAYGLRPIGFLDAHPLLGTQRLGNAVPVLGGPEQLTEAIRATGAHHVILAFSSEPDHVLVAAVRQCQALGVEVSLVPRLYESINERATLHYVGGLPLLALRPVDPRGWQFALKHTIDRTVALLALVLLAPLMGLIALAVRASSPGPILFRQRRVGRDGHVFDVLKFRTMRTAPPVSTFELAAGSAPGGIEGEDRRTWLGCFLRDSSLDELPQLLNVLRGDMSLVGPRPERPEFVERFAREVAGYEDRHRVRSGITGWAQVNGLRGQTSIADRVEWDNYYIQNWSLRLDLRIVALTVVEILRYCSDR
jgi:exopolysaccharide biosynthesis polyprenyl glycosylphosphotransferase